MNYAILFFKYPATTSMNWESPSSKHQTSRVCFCFWTVNLSACWHENHWTSQCDRLRFLWKSQSRTWIGNLSCAQSAPSKYPHCLARRSGMWVGQGLAMSQFCFQDSVRISKCILWYLSRCSYPMVMYRTVCYWNGHWNREFSLG